MGNSYTSIALWDTFAFPEVNTTWVKIVVESVYTSGSNGFKEIEFYHDSCNIGMRIFFMCECVKLNMIPFTKTISEVLLRATFRRCYISYISSISFAFFLKLQIKFVITKPLMLEKAVNHALCTVAQHTHFLNRPVT